MLPARRTDVTDPERATIPRTFVSDDERTSTRRCFESASQSCATLAPDLETSCYYAVEESFRLRREAMLRRALKEGASIKAAAQLYGYSEEEVARWIDKNVPTDRGYTEPEETPAAQRQRPMLCRQGPR